MATTDPAVLAAVERAIGRRLTEDDPDPAPPPPPERSGGRP